MSLAPWTVESTALLVVAPDAAVARWCAQPIELGHPGLTLQPLVVGPDAIPVMVDEQAARKDPELAVLSAMAHGHAEVGPLIAQTVMAAVAGLEAAGGPGSSPTAAARAVLPRS